VCRHALDNFKNEIKVDKTPDPEDVKLRDYVFVRSKKEIFYK
jgi:hypothetical protein